VAVTRKQIRQDVLTELGDGFVATATDAGTTTQFVDSNTLVLPTSEYRGRTIWFSGGTMANLEASRKINGSSGSSVQWGVALPAPTAPGDQAEFWNYRGTGWEPQEVNRLIQIAHRDAQEHLPIADVSDEKAWSASVGSLAIPDHIIAVTGVQYYDLHQNTWRNIDRATRPASPGYWVEKHDRTITINGRLRFALDTYAVRIRGYAREEELTADDKTTQVNREYLVARVCELACAALLLRTEDPGLVRDKWQFYQREAGFKRTLAVPRRATNVDRVD